MSLKQFIRQARRDRPAPFKDQAEVYALIRNIVAAAGDSVPRYERHPKAKRKAISVRVVDEPRVVLETKVRKPKAKRKAKA